MLEPLVGATVAMAGFLILWPWSLVRRDASLADLWWGPGFAAMVWTAWALAGAATGPAGWAALALVSAWALRMGLVLGLRRLREGGEDPRYAALRAAHGARWPLRSLFQVFVLQGVLQGLIALPAAVMAAGAGPAGLGALGWAGIGVALAGLALEGAADRQLDLWRASGRTGLMRSGLRAWARHPNYAGEILFWSGLALIGLGAGLWWAPFSPLLVGLLLVHVSGRPILEERLARHPGWARYAARVPAFVPRAHRLRAALRRAARGGGAARRAP